MMNASQRALKRAADLVAGVTGLVMLAPVIAATAVAVRCTMGSPVLFRQLRPGLHGRGFELVKFRTMANTPQEGLAAVSSDAQRITPLGTWLRSTSLDELPSLWNLVTGDMSLVGPRPLLMEYLQLYEPWQARRHEVRPGLTGLAQVRGRNLLDWDDRLRADVEYVDRQSILLDLWILGRTVAVVASRTGVTAEGGATMQPFTGRSAEGVA